MNERLEDAVRAARTRSPAWDDSRSARALGNAWRTRRARDTRARFIHRTVIVASALAVVVLVVLRGAASSGSDAALSDTHDGSVSMHASARFAGDGGYGRD